MNFKVIVGITLFLSACAPAPKSSAEQETAAKLNNARVDFFSREAVKITRECVAAKLHIPTVKAKLLTSGYQQGVLRVFKPAPEAPTVIRFSSSSFSQYGCSMTTNFRSDGKTMRNATANELKRLGFETTDGKAFAKGGLVYKLQGYTLGAGETVVSISES